MGNFLECILANYMIITKTHNKDNESNMEKKYFFFFLKFPFMIHLMFPSLIFIL
jgi:hypothetical protein